MARCHCIRKWCALSAILWKEISMTSLAFNLNYGQIFSFLSFFSFFFSFSLVQAILHMANPKSFTEKLDKEALDYFNMVCKKPFSQQAVAFLNAYWPEVHNEADFIFSVAWEKMKYADMETKGIMYLYQYDEGIIFLFLSLFFSFSFFFFSLFSPFISY